VKKKSTCVEIFLFSPNFFLNFGKNDLKFLEIFSFTRPACQLISCNSLYLKLLAAEMKVAYFMLNCIGRELFQKINSHYRLCFGKVYRDGFFF